MGKPEYGTGTVCAECKLEEVGPLIVLEKYVAIEDRCFAGFSLTEFSVYVHDCKGHVTACISLLEGQDR